MFVFVFCFLIVFVENRIKCNLELFCQRFVRFAEFVKIYIHLYLGSK